jgi:gamma-glutamyltranspeptidase/glutathione hydrolase
LEAKKLAFEDRAKFYADPDFAQLPIEKLISKEYARERAKLIDPNRAASNYPAGVPETRKYNLHDNRRQRREHGSLIQSNYRGMGSE